MKNPCESTPRRLDPWGLALLALLAAAPFAAFVPALLIGVAMAVVSLPTHRRLVAWLARSWPRFRAPALASAALIGAAWGLLAMLPLSIVAALAAPVVPKVLHSDGLFQHTLAHLTQWGLRVSGHVPILDRQLQEHAALAQRWLAQHPLTELLSQHLRVLRQWSSLALRVVLQALVALAVNVWILLDCERVGLATLQALRRIFSGEFSERLARATLEATRAVLLGGLAMALWDAALCAALFEATRVPYALLWAMAISLASWIPGGTTVLLVLAGAMLALQGHAMPAAAVWLVGNAIVLCGDWVIKPRWIGRKAHAPFLVVLLSIFGGVSLWGALGVLAGPISVLVAKDMWFSTEKSFCPD